MIGVANTMTESVNFTVVFETGKSHEILMVLNALKNQGVPVYGQQISISGLVTAMPTTPVAMPGITWMARVPDSALPQAKSVIASLPLHPVTNPGVWHFGPRPASKKIWQWYIWVIIVFVLAGILSNVCGLFR